MRKDQASPWLLLGSAGVSVWLVGQEKVTEKLVFKDRSEEQRKQEPRLKPLFCFRILDLFIYEGAHARVMGNPGGRHVLHVSSGGGSQLSQCDLLSHLAGP